MKKDQSLSFDSYLAEALEKDSELKREYAIVVKKTQLIEAIAKMRKEESMTQTDLAEALGVSQAVIGRFESGKTENPSINFVEKVANALGYNMNITFEKQKN